MALFLLAPMIKLPSNGRQVHICCYTSCSFEQGENCKTKTRPGTLRAEKARTTCTEQFHRIVLVKCTRPAVQCYS